MVYDDNYFLLEQLRLFKFNLCEFVDLYSIRNMLQYSLGEGDKIKYITKINNYTSKAGRSVNYRNTTSYIACGDSFTKVVNNSDIKRQIDIERMNIITSEMSFRKKSAKQYCNSVNSLYAVGRSSLNFNKFLRAAEIEQSQTSENRSDLEYSLGNNIVSFKNEKFRSKNELIFSSCLQHCGLSYCLEPLYPESGMRADFGVFCAVSQKNDNSYVFHKNPKQIFVEITGMRTDFDYDEKIKLKREIACKYKIPLIIVDMTGYPNADGKSYTKIHCNHICELLTRLYFGYLRTEGQIYLPYA